MKVVQINAIYGEKSTGTIVYDIDRLLQDNGEESVVVYRDGLRSVKNRLETPCFANKN